MVNEANCVAPALNCAAADLGQRTVFISFEFHTVQRNGLAEQVFGRKRVATSFERQLQRLLRGLIQIQDNESHTTFDAFCALRVHVHACGRGKARVENASPHQAFPEPCGLIIRARIQGIGVE